VKFRGGRCIISPVNTSQLARRILFWLLCIASIGVLLGHLYALAPMSQLGLFLLLPCTILMASIWVHAHRANDKDFTLRVKAGLLGGLWGTMGYDLVRIPLHFAGQNPFTPIRAYGTWLVGADYSTLWSDTVGFLYHLSNGITFGWIFAILMFRRHWAFAVAWGVVLETLAVATAFGEVFAIRTAYSTLVVAYVAHLFYGYPLGRICAKPEQSLASIHPLSVTSKGWATLALPPLVMVWFITAWQPIGNQPSLKSAQIELGPDAVYPGWSDLEFGKPVEVVNRFPETTELTIRHPGPSGMTEERIELAANETRSIDLTPVGIHQLLLREKRFRSVFVSVRRGNDYRAGN
jgi:hypothetical protein